MNNTKLIVLRGPSGSGKSSAALAIRNTQIKPMALIQQDYLRRILLKEKDILNGLNIQLIQQTTLFALDHGYNVIMEGIFDKSRYSQMFEELLKVHPDNNYFFYFDVSLKETLKRHQSKPNKGEFGEKEMKEWYRKKDFLDGRTELAIPESYTLEEIVEHILAITKL